MYMCYPIEQTCGCDSYFNHNYVCALYSTQGQS